MRQQLLSSQWYPATAKVPQTCFTFRLLEHFHMMTLVGKITSYDYYRGLEKLTNNAGSFPFKNRYDSFRRVTREWCHLKSLKRGGRGNDGIRAIEQTTPGELAVLCPACPRESVNLPENWMRADRKKRFLYTLFLAVDACFRLKRKMVSSEVLDPGFGTGWSYMVPDEPYRRYLLEMTSATELPEEQKPRSLPDFQFVIPKLHIYGHTTDCQLKYSLNYAPGVGRTDGEGVERNWAGQGPIATSTTEMGPGSRHDALDDHWGSWNWQKLLGLGVLLSRRLKLASEWRDKQEAMYRSFTLNQAAHVPQWQQMVEEYEEDPTKPNPYEYDKEGITIQEVRAQLSAEELAKTPHGPSNEPSQLM
ncbi:hypothetical protein VNI00_015849 [Paramarasmius palmivorus]|uniref:CxC2-like cysteine cluster KDZ transposase-associated domain-containing protein n=1 Tax=Paramarasmius palmivorus TaxID=297713 RepID=A0AAW0BL00_9AGAR